MTCVEARSEEIDHLLGLYSETSIFLRIPLASQKPIFEIDQEPLKLL